MTTESKQPYVVERRVCEGVAEIERLLGARAELDAPPSLLVEVPHGADTRAHYDALRARLVGDLPADLHEFFHVNTDIGAYQYGRRVAEMVVSERPTSSVLVVRSLIPRTFIDCNRLEDTPDTSGQGGVTAGIAPYVEDERDRALLVDLHRAYVAIAERSYADVCNAGGMALCPHTFGPYELPIAKIDRDIVQRLRELHRPEVLAKLAKRPEVDLLTRDRDNARHAPEGMVEELTADFAAVGLTATESVAYRLVPGTQTYRFAVRYPGRVLCLEVRRDLLVEAYTALTPMRVRADAVERIAAPIAAAVVRWMDRRRAVAG